MKTLPSHPFLGNHSSSHTCLLLTYCAFISLTFWSPAGFIGKQLVGYLAKNKLASKIVVADKVLPEVAGLSAEESAIYKSDLVKFVQVNLAREQTSQKVYDAAGGQVDFVFNLAAATKYSQAPEVYKENVVDTAKTSAAAAAKNKVKRFIHVSTGQVYEDGKEAKEDAKKLKPVRLPFDFYNAVLLMYCCYLVDQPC